MINKKICDFGIYYKLYNFGVHHVTRKTFCWWFWDALYTQSGKDTISDISQSVSKSVSCILTPACHKIHFPASGRDEIRKLEDGSRKDPPRNPLLLLFSQREEYKRYSLLTQDYFHGVCSKRRKIFLCSDSIIFILGS